MASRPTKPRSRLLLLVLRAQVVQQPAPFHLAFPTHSVEAARAFYGG
jgi:hypothetical protein